MSLLEANISTLKRLLLVGIGLIIAGLLRWKYLDVLTWDVRTFVIPWYDYILTNGSSAFGVSIPTTEGSSANYSPPYYYLLYLVTLLDGWAPKLYLIKLVFIIFDLIAAAFVYKIIRLLSSSAKLPWLAFLTVLLAPTVIANGALWGMGDSIVASLVLGSVYFSLLHKPFWTMSLFGLALSIKAQAIFLSPYLFGLLLSARIPWIMILLVPAAYTLSMGPAVVMGRPINDVFLIYLRQSSVFGDLSMNAPNLYYFVSYCESEGICRPNLYFWGTVLGIIITVSVSLLFAWRMWFRGKHLCLRYLLLSATLSLMMSPFLLPKMHDRYFFSADICSIALGFVVPRLWFVPLGVQLSSVIAYMPILSAQLYPDYFGPGGFTDLMPLAIFINTALIICLSMEFFDHSLWRSAPRLREISSA